MYSPAAYLPCPMRIRPTQVESAEQREDESEPPLHEAHRERLDARSREIVQRRWMTDDTGHAAPTRRRSTRVSAERIRQIESSALGSCRGLSWPRRPPELGKHGRRRARQSLVVRAPALCTVHAFHGGRHAQRRPTGSPTTATSHQHPTNKLLHWICVPPIVLAVMGLLWSLQLPARPLGGCGPLPRADGDRSQASPRLLYYLMLSPRLAAACSSSPSPHWLPAYARARRAPLAAVGQSSLYSSSPGSASSPAMRSRAGVRSSRICSSC